MVKFLERLSSKGAALPKAGQGGRKRTSDQAMVTARPEGGMMSYRSRRQENGRIPNASVIYGLASAVLVVIAVYTVFSQGSWGTGLLLLLPAGALFGYAIYFMRYQGLE